MNRVLVLMAVRNGERWIEAQVCSILSQDFVDVDLLISDDASSDKTVDVLNKLNILNEKVRLIIRESGSGSAGENFRSLIRECDLSNYDYVALSDQDDIWKSMKVSMAIELLKEKKCQGYSSAVEAIWSNGRKKKLLQANNRRSADFLFEGGGQGCTFVIEVELFRNIQVFCNENKNTLADFHYHDWLIYLLVRAWGGGWCFDSRVSMIYRQHEGNEIGARGGFVGFYRRIKLIKSGWLKQQVALAAKIFNQAIVCNRGNAQADLSEAIFVSKLISEPPGLSRRLGLAIASLKYGRRRTQDRIIIALASLLGYI